MLCCKPYLCRALISRLENGVWVSGQCLLIQYGLCLLVTHGGAAGVCQGG